MADHIRTQVRDAIVTAVTGLTTTGARVYGSNVHQVGPTRVPGLLVYTPAEDIPQEEVTGNAGSRNQTRYITCMIEGVAAVAGDVDDTLDTISKEVEIAIAADPTLGGVVKDIYLESTDKELNGDGEKRTGVVMMEFTAVTRTAENAPDVAID